MRTIQDFQDKYFTYFPIAEWMIFLAPKKLWLQQQPAVQKGSLPMAIWQQPGGGDYYDDFDDEDDFYG